MSSCQNVGVVEVFDTVASLRREDVRSQPDPSIELMGHDDVQADLITLRSRVDPHVVYRERQTPPSLSNVLFLHLAGKHREGHLCQQCRLLISSSSRHTVPLIVSHPGSIYSTRLYTDLGASSPLTRPAAAHHPL